MKAAILLTLTILLGISCASFGATITRVAAGGWHTIALKSDGTVWAWGNNSSGQLGNDTADRSSTPVQVSSLSEVTAIAAGWDHTIARKSDGTVWTWGHNDYGQLGNGTSDWNAHPLPVQVQSLTGITAIAGGMYHTIVLKSDGTVWAWGENVSGQLGNGTIAKAYPRGIPTPVQVQGLTGVTAVAGGGLHTIALKNDGTVWAWGYNSYGELGNGTTSSSPTPVQVQGLTGITAVAGGNYHTIALKNDGTVWAWGHNGYGQLGNGTTTTSPPYGTPTPVQVQGLSGVTAIAGGGDHTIALKSDGTVWAWGHNDYGQLGNGTSDWNAHPLPVQVQRLSGIAAIAAGDCHTIALKTDGTVWAWGHNGWGQLGNGTTTSPPLGISSPVQVQNLTGVIAIAGGDSRR